MFRRWFFRSLFAVLLALCAAAWISSYWQGFYAQHSTTTRAHALAAGGGSIWFIRFPSYSGLVAGWICHGEENPQRFRREWYQSADYRLLGFAIGPQAPRWTGWVVVMPLWFLTLSSALLFTLVWYKTRACRPAGAFPVLVADPEA
jgi:hypothetical protein